ncbi:hypothetical protein [Nocardia sp. NPDC052112]|uniref:hypothetical protein n=1 Tax=Nocardia sp. NPDC052112 TaxID=3155646 RepID=UPI003413C536
MTANRIGFLRPVTRVTAHPPSNRRNPIVSIAGDIDPFAGIPGQPSIDRRPRYPANAAICFCRLLRPTVNITTQDRAYEHRNHALLAEGSAMAATRDVRLAGWAGIISVIPIPVLFFVSGRFPDFTPGLGASSTEVAEWISHNLTAIQIQTGAGVAIVLYIWFAAGLVELLKQPPDASGVPARLVGWGTTAAVAVSVTSYATWSIATFLPKNEPGQAVVARAMVDTALVVYIYTYAPLGIILFGAGIGIRRSTTFPRPLGSAALILAGPNLAAAATAMITSGPLEAGGFLTLIPMTLFCLWVCATGIAMVRWNGSSSRSRSLSGSSPHDAH